MKLGRRIIGSSLVLAVACLVTVGLSSARGAAPATSASPQPGALSQYVDSGGAHWDTTGTVTSGYSLQSTLGFLDPSDDAGTASLYSCTDSSGDIHFLSLSSGCNGQTPVSLLGYIYTSASTSAASVPLFECSDGPDQFASTDSSCGGDTVVSQLGYLLSSGYLYRYNAGYHWATTGTAPSNYSPEAGLGYLVSSAYGAQALYGCMTSTYQYLSLDPTCAGNSVLGVEGWDDGAAMSSPQTAELFLCNGGASEFESNASNCEGQPVIGPLGYMLTQPLAIPASTSTPPTNSTTAPTSTTPTTETTPQTTTVVATTPSTPAKGTTGTGKKGTTKAKPQLKVPIVLGWTWSGALTRLRALRFMRLPPHSTVTITCTGKRCAKNLGTTAPSGGRKRLKLATLVAHAKADIYRAGQRVVITVTRSGYISERIVLTIHTGRIPTSPSTQKQKAKKPITEKPSTKKAASPTG